MLFYAVMGTVEFTCAEELQNFPEPIKHQLSTAHPGYVHMPSIIPPLSAVYNQNELLLLRQALLHNTLIQTSN